MRLPPSTDGEDLRVTLLRELWPELARYVRHRLKQHEWHLVEDFMHEAAADFTAAWRDNGPMSRGDAAAVLKRAAEGDILNHWDKTRRRRTFPFSIDAEVLLDHADPRSDNELLAALGRIDHRRLLDQLPRLLTERQQEIVVAVDVDGLTQKAAAERLGISVRGLQKARDGALHRLRHHLSPDPPAVPSPPSPASADQPQHQSRETP